MSGQDETYLALSGVQHYAYCPRQWALIHIEQQWADNGYTAEGQEVHHRCHDGSIKERRGDVIIVRGLTVVSHSLQIAGVCDVVEFHRCSEESAARLSGEEGYFRPIPVEYKRGRRKPQDEDRLQLCAQAVALEEMFCCEIRSGYLFYDSEKRRESVEFSDALRESLSETCHEMRKCYERGYVPKARKEKRCTRCSLLDVCNPGLFELQSVSAYMADYVDG